MRALAVLGLTALSACAPADPAARAEQLWAACRSNPMQQQRVEACSAIIEDASTAPARRAEALVQRGVLRGEMMQDARAAADFGRALRIDPNLVRAYVERGELHFSREAFDAAIRDLDAALALAPGLREAMDLREAAVRGRQDGGWDQLDLITQALAERPYDSMLWNNRCWVRAVSGEDLEFALADCNEALRLNPRNTAALDSRGLVHFKRGDYGAALADYEAALAIEPGRGHYLYGRGMTRIRMGAADAGRADLAAAERAEPGVAATYRNYGVEI